MSALSFPQPPKSICILRLSAIGDITHMLPVIATIQTQWPKCRITWVIGQVEYQLVESLKNVEFIVFNKRKGFSELIQLRKKLAGRDFDVLLMMQVALRASLASLFIKSPIRIGYDSKRSRDLQRLFCNQQIEGPDRVHVVDTFFQFLEKLGIEKRQMDWLLKPGPDDARFASEIVGHEPCVIVNPCSSTRKHNWRNWARERYAEIVDHLHSMDVKVILTGGPDEREIAMSDEISRLCKSAPISLVGKTTLTQLLALVEQSVCVLAPDTGPAHIATVCGKPVIGLYASSNPDRTGPYNSLAHCINLYPEALQKFSGKTVNKASWGERVRHPEVMNLITVNAVKDQLAAVLID